MSFTIELPDSAHLDEFSKRMLTDYFRSELRINGINDSDIKVIEADNLDFISIKKCFFPKELEDFLIENNLSYLNELSRYRFTEIYSIVSMSGDTENNMRYINERMKTYGLDYRDISTDRIICVSDCGFKKRTADILKNNGFYFLQNLTAVTAKDFGALKNVGELTVSEVTEKLREYGLDFMSEENAGLMK